VNTNLYKRKRPTPTLTKERNNERKKKHKGLDMEQIYGHGSQRGSMPGMIVPGVIFCFYNSVAGYFPESGDTRVEAG
jgi:hypothetical protein